MINAKILSNHDNMDNNDANFSSKALKNNEFNT